jgi:hypothetical protein
MGIKNTEKRGKRQMHTVEPGIWQEDGKTWKTGQKHCMTWNMARNTEKRENEKYTL